MFSILGFIGFRDLGFGVGCFLGFGLFGALAGELFLAFERLCFRFEGPLEHTRLRKLFSQPTSGRERPIWRRSCTCVCSCKLHR